MEWIIIAVLTLALGLQSIRAWWWKCRFIEERLYGPGYDRPVILKNSEILK